MNSEKATSWTNKQKPHKVEHFHKALLFMRYHVYNYHNIFVFDITVTISVYWWWIQHINHQDGLLAIYYVSQSDDSFGGWKLAALPSVSDSHGL